MKMPDTFNLTCLCGATTTLHANVQFDGKAIYLNNIKISCPLNSEFGKCLAIYHTLKSGQIT